MDDNLKVLQAAYNAWTACAKLRHDRLRNKRFAYGDQWRDATIGPDGRAMTEWERYSQCGGSPVTNNVLRQLIKAVVGRFRSQSAANAPANERLKQVYGQNELDELDSRALEEFVISGCCLQRVGISHGLAGNEVSVSNVNLNRFFVNAFTDVRARDCEIIGQIHDLSVADLVRRVAGGSRRKAAWVRACYSEQASDRIAAFTTSIGADSQSGADFWHCRDNRCRAIEVWTLESHEAMLCHDRNTAQVELLPLSIAKRRRKAPGTSMQWRIVTTWHCRWFSPMGHLLAQYASPWAHGSHPFVIKLYPLTDGEVHSFIEDVIDQQKMVNRLVTLLDRAMVASAKGVLLYPENAVPDGMSWNDIKRVWRDSNGILPYIPGIDGSKPEQITTNATNFGAYDMINLQLKMLEEISGVTGALQGRDVAGNSATLYKAQADNACIALADLYGTFDSFRRLRDRKILAL